MANIFARGSRERAPIALLAKCELPQSTLCFAFSIRHGSPKRKNHAVWRGFRFGDPWENRTPVTAVKGRCLSRLTNGPLVAGIGFEPMTYRV